MSNDIAVIGMAGRFPKAQNLNELFENLKEGKDCVHDITAERLKSTALPASGNYIKCGYLTDIDKFDNTFFGISNAEAVAMCPDQRLLLEIVHETMEQAGYAPSALSGSNTSVFVAKADSKYYEHASEFQTTLVTGNSQEFLAAKIGRHFNLQGNVSVVDTTCSSSLVALHAAVNELILGDADMALVGSVNLKLFPFVGTKGLDTHSSDGISRAFSKQSNGMSYGESVAAVLLKPLDKALADQDNIQAIVKGTAVNYNGDLSSSITAPDSQSQARVFEKAWKKAGIAPTDLSFIEAHGSGTQLGDSLEFEALNLAFGKYTDQKHICPISTIKSNMGHGRNAAGLAGLVKAVLSLKHKTLLPNIHFDEPSDLLDYDNSVVYVNTELGPWEVAPGKTRIAGLTSLGASGTNTHVVLEEAPEREPKKIQEDAQVIRLSGKSQEALQRNIESLSTYLGDEKNSKVSLADIAYTLQTGRDHYAHRYSVSVSSVEALRFSLEEEIIPVQVSEGTGKLILLSSDSSDELEAAIAKMKQSNPGFSSLWESIATEAEIKSTSQKDFAYQYVCYQLLEQAGIQSEQFLPLGIGAILSELIDEEISLKEALEQAKNYEASPLESKTDRFKKLVERLTESGHATVIDLSVNGMLSEPFSAYTTQLEAALYYLGDWHQQEAGLATIHQQLYLRGFQTGTPDPVGQRIELPTYQFDKTRFWLRDEPRTLEEDSKHEAAIQVKEDCDGLEFSLAAIFGEVLELSTISIHDNFFDLGGDSLRATRVIKEINQAFKMSLDFEDIFDFPTAHGMAYIVRQELGTEKKLILIWENTLKTQNLKASDDFFELGGHSLLATELIVKMNNEFKLNMNFDDIFRNPTIGALQAFIDELLADSSKTTTALNIELASEKPYYALSHAQKRMWFLHQFVGGSSTYNNILGIQFNGKLDYACFNQAILALVERHESLRSTFHMEEEEPKQRVHATQVFNFEAIIDEAATSSVDRVDEIIQEEQGFIFDLSEGPLFRIRLIKTSAQSHVCILNIHHVISDGWSIGVLIDDISSFYNHYSTSSELKMNPLQIQMKDFAEWQQGPLFQELLAEQEQYWLSQFGDEIPVLELPLSKPRKSVQSFEGNVLRMRFDEARTKALHELGRKEGATLFMVLLSFYNILLSKLANTADLSVGSPVAGRRFQGTAPLIGLFMNTVVLRNRPEGALPFKEFLANVKQCSLDAFNHQDYPYEELVNQLKIERTTGRNPLFDTMFILHNNRKTSVDFEGIEAESYGIPSKTARFDLLVECTEDEGGLNVKFEYATALFDQSRIEEFMEAFQEIVHQVLENPAVKLRDISLLSEQEKTRLLTDFNATSVDFEVADKTIVSAFAASAKANAKAPALTFEGNTLTYQELHERSNALAHTLIEKGVEIEDRIGVLVPRSPEMMIALLAVLKAGGAYIPLDPSYPSDRVLDIIEDSGLKLLIRGDAIADELKCAIQVPTIDVADTSGWSTCTDLPDVALKPDHLAYLIYTSGSTGRPKGVMIEHRSVINFVYGVRDRIRFEPDATMLCLTTVSFDIFVLESFLPLLTGMHVVLASEADQLNPAELLQLAQKESVGMMQITSSHLNMLLASTSEELLPEVHTLMVGGEAFPQELLGKVKDRFEGRIYNMYGPTETTIWSTIQDLSHQDKIDIGKPIANTTIRIVDQDMNLQPIGIVGELCIGGAGLSRGYWNRATLTSEKFISDPHATSGKIYKTGDQARWKADGSIECLGRKDDQVKIRGFRIELGEVGHQLASLDQVDQAVVVVREVGGEFQLVGYYTSEETLESSQLRGALSAHLPEYMIPSLLVQLSEFPLTPNGKINKRALPEPEMEQVGEAVAPVTDTENELAGIWAAILRIEESLIGQESDFFSLGGHSIRAVTMINKVQEQFEVVLPLRKVFENASLKQLSTVIDGFADKAVFSEITATEPKDTYLASPAQERIFFRQTVTPETLVFNISSVLKIPTETEYDRIQEAFDRLIERHESLRTNLMLTDDGVRQVVHQQVPFAVQCIDTGNYNDLRAAFLDFVKPFDLTSDVLMRVGLLFHEDWGQIMLIDIHHVIADGISLQLLIDDFKEIFLDQNLEPVNLHYKDYAEWQQASPQQEENEAYWGNQLTGIIPRLELPTLTSREGQQFEKAAQQVLNIDERLYASLKEATATHQVSDFMYLLSAFYVLLGKMSGNTDIIVGTDVMGRNHPQLHKVVGSFVNILPLRLTLEDEEPFEAWLKRVRSCVLDAFDHQDYQFDQMIDLVGDNHQEPGNPIFDVHFSFSNTTEGQPVLDEVGFEFLEPGGKLTTQYELKLEVFHEEGKYGISFVYSEDMYDAEIIDLFVNYYHNILKQIVANPELHIGAIELDQPMDVSI